MVSGIAAIRGTNRPRLATTHKGNPSKQWILATVHLLKPLKSFDWTDVVELQLTASELNILSIRKGCGNVERLILLRLHPSVRTAGRTVNRGSYLL